jgi:glycolate oxidase FAD binding subunit
MTAGRPVESAQTISLASDRGIVEYVPDDLTITARAGPTLTEIAAAARENGQWLPLDPFGGANATIGAAIATASSGPLAHSSGLARDFILGLELVTGKGDVIRSGGRVVKNVAGFDLMRLNCGAWGTLGVITQASLRLYALPKVDRTFALPVTGGFESTAALLHSLRTGPLAALAMEGIHPTVSSTLGLPPSYFVLVRLGGNEKLVDAQLATLGKIGKPVETAADVWTRLTEADPPSHEIVLRLSGLPTNIVSLWQTAHALVDASESAFLHSTFSRGTVRLALKGLRAGVELPRSSASQRVTYETLPADLWRSVSPSVTSDRLSQSVKRAFDPAGILNPGILG